jgi:hypothetical protein
MDVDTEVSQCTKHPSNERGPRSVRSPQTIRPETRNAPQGGWVAEHMSRTWLQRVLRQEPGRQFGSSFPDHGVQAEIESRELGPEPHKPDPAIDLCHHVVLSVSICRAVGP